MVWVLALTQQEHCACVLLCLSGGGSLRACALVCCVCTFVWLCFCVVCGCVSVRHEQLELYALGEARTNSTDPVPGLSGEDALAVADQL